METQASEYVTPPTPPANFVVVLTINEQGRPCGWCTPDSVGEVRYRKGVTFVLLTQSDIDQFIPAHSLEIDRERVEEAEYLEEQQERAAARAR